MKLGTAKITLKFNRLYEVTWMNVGNFLKNEPRYFETERDARDWCKDRGLRVVS